MGLHPLDLAVLTAYFVVVIWLGKRAAKSTATEEGFFLAGRKLGKLYQFFLNFGNATDVSSAVSTASLVYQQGVSGVWLSFQLIFANPYYWFMNTWFRRVRLITMADLFEERLGSRGLARFYAIFQTISAMVVIIGFGYLVTYKISAALIVKPAAAWTPAERASVDGYHDLKRLEKAAAAGPLAPADKSRLDVLRERDARGELSSTITPLNPVVFYFGYAALVGTYIVLGGMAATAVNDVIQSILIVVFSILLVPTGLTAAGGLHALRERVPAAMFELVSSAGSADVSALSLVAIVFVAIIQINGIIGNMGISGSATNEFAARFGAVTGTFGKRLMIILWALCGLIALALYHDATALSDPDAAWGTMSRQLLGPGLLGLMMAGILAANMSRIAAETMCVSALFVRNVYQHFRPNLGQRDMVRVGRWMIAIALVGGVFAALRMNDVFSAVQLMQTVNLPFGAAVMLMFFWRRLTAAAVWIGVLLASLLNIVAPLALPQLDAVSTAPALVVRSTDSHGAPSAVYFESVVRVRPDDPQSPLVGRGRFHVELYLLHLAGLDVPRLSPSQRFAARFFFNGVSPFVLLIVISLLTRPPSRERIDQFFGKMKTPVAPTPEMDDAAMEATRRDPRRFDHLKLFPRSTWEFTRWNRVDAIGFVACCATSLAIIALFWGLLRLIAP
jgi:Na+/proline symporter